MERHPIPALSLAVLAFAAFAALAVFHQAANGCWTTAGVFPSPSGSRHVERQRSACDQDEAVALFANGRLIERVVIVSGAEGDLADLGVVWLSDTALRVFVPVDAPVAIGERKYGVVRVEYAAAPFSEDAQALIDEQTPGRIASVEWRRHRREARERAARLSAP